MGYIGVCGIGVVGLAVLNCFKKRGILLKVYDKYKNNGIGKISDLLESKIIFLCLPTVYSIEKKEYDKTAIYEVCDYLKKNNYNGIVVIKSTVEPGTCRELNEKYNLNIINNPEFLTARTAEEDFEKQNHIVIGGKTNDDKNIEIIKQFYDKYWGNILTSTATYEESELMKIGVNSFYATKIQFFNEIYSLTNTFDDAKYEKIISMMLKNNWISPNHVDVPGTDGKISYGGMCFPKDTNALNQLMIKKGTPNKVLESVILERNIMRNDKNN